MFNSTTEGRSSRAADYPQNLSASDDLATQLQLLYELALATNGSMNVVANCQKFLSVLLARKRIAVACIWVKTSVLSVNSNATSYSLVCAKPSVRARVSTLSDEHRAVQLLRDVPLVTVNDTETQFREIAFDADMLSGSFALFRLEGFGILGLYTESAPYFDRREVNQLRNVVELFARGLGGALADQRLGQETTQRQLLERRLAQAEKLEAVGQLAGGIAHDFNNLLTVVLGFAQLGERTESGDVETVTRYFEQIRVAALRGQDLVSQLMAFRADENRDRVHVDVSTSVHEVAKLISATFPATLSLEVTTALMPTIWLESGQLQQLVMNLCINARDALGGVGKICIDASVRDTTATTCTACGEAIDGRYVVVAVRDNGPGFNRELLDRVFDPFFTTKGPGEGSGLGLSVVYGILHNSGGHILIANNHTAQDDTPQDDTAQDETNQDETNGRGATVSLYFPVVSESVETVSA